MKKDSFVTISIKENKSAEEIMSILQYSGIETHIRQSKYTYRFLSKNKQRIRVHNKNIGKALRIIQDYDNNKFTNIFDKRKIIVPIDYQNDAFNALKFAYDLSLNTRKEILILHVNNSPRIASELELLMSKSERIRWINSTHLKSVDQLQLYVEKILKLGGMNHDNVIIHYYLKSGIAENIIEKMVYTSMPDILIMTIRNETSIKNDNIGSISIQVINRVVIPILLIPVNYKLDFKQNIRVVMLCHTNSIIFQLDHLVHLFGNVKIDCLSISLIKHNSKDIINDSLKERINSKYANVNIKYTNVFITKGNDIQTIKDIAYNYNANLYIINNQRHTLLSRFIKRSMASRLAYGCDIPIMIVSKYR